MKHIGTIAAIIFLTTTLCSSCQRHGKDKQDTHEVPMASAQDTSGLILDYKLIVKDKSYSSIFKKTLEDGSFNDFFTVKENGLDVFLAYESAKDKGFPTPDEKYVYAIGNIMANSTGWTNTFIIYQINTSTFKVEFLNAVAAWRLEKDGFTVAAETRCTTPEATCSAQMDFAFEDITYDFDGKIKHRSKEYPSEEIKRKYKNSDQSEVYQ